MISSHEVLKCQVLIIGGGAAGAFAGIKLGEENLDVIVADKGHIKRSGCLAAGVNALNAHINRGYTVEDYVNYVSEEFSEIVREDLVYSIGERLNKVTTDLEKFGLPILKDEEGNYVERGRESVRINGENIKGLLYDKLRNYKNIKLLNGVNIVDYIVEEGEIKGAYGFSVKEEKFYFILAERTICATGGASGLYLPNNPGFSRHKMWYSPFNTGAGYAMGLRAGAEMTSFEMRFIALRIKDTIAPTGTIAQGLKVPQINSLGEEYMDRYGKKTTVNRLYGTIREKEEGRGPCFLRTKGVPKEKDDEIFKAYLNMAPSQTLRWVENGTSPSTENVEIEGTEPYIVGGHSGAGYWIDEERRTTLKNLYAVGDVAGGSPKKYVTGAMAEGEIAAEKIVYELKNDSERNLNDENEANSDSFSYSVKEIIMKQQSYFGEGDLKQLEEFELKIQRIMDKYAGGISTGYRYSTKELFKALEKLEELKLEYKNLKCTNYHELLFIHEIRDRLLVSEVLIHHLLERKETRFRLYGEYVDFPNVNKNLNVYINSKVEEEKIKIIKRNLVKGAVKYVHKNKQ